MTLVKASTNNAVIRFGNGPLTMIAVGDRVGRNGAEVKEIAAGRVVLEEVFTGKDGRPNRAQVIVTVGQTGGTRYVARPEEEVPAANAPTAQPPPQAGEASGGRN